MLARVAVRSPLLSPLPSPLPSSCSAARYGAESERRAARLGSIALALLLAGCAGFGKPTPVVSPGASWVEVSRAGRHTAEGVVAAPDGRIYASDITRPDDVKENNPGGTIWRLDPATGRTEKYIEPSGMANGLHFDRNGDLIIAQEAASGGRAIQRHNLATGRTVTIADRYDGKRLVGPNDVTSDAAGRIYFTDARYFGDEPMEMPNAVYRIDPDGRVVRLASDIVRPNGIEVSPDGKRLYVAATNLPVRLARNPLGPATDRFGFKLGGVAVYDLDARGDVSNGRVFFRTDEFVADGMTMDTEGNLYVAIHNGNREPADGRIVVLNPAGEVIETIRPPAGWRPGNLGFGRGRDAGSLYMTTLFEWRLFRLPTNRRGHYFER
jgi:gluconolactonase